MMCPCGRQWDVNDPDPPECHKGAARAATLAERRAEKREPILTPHDGSAGNRLAFRIVPTTAAHVPAELPEGLARDMSRAHRAARERTGSDVEAMRAAYRVFLDCLP
ncbi:MAG TPA: hypothetical protein VNT52_01035 [Acidimicrobiales bacterium]|nr:hypothetical protein [Acidimicrobiales bacterium]